MSSEVPQELCGEAAFLDPWGFCSVSVSFMINVCSRIVVVLHDLRIPWGPSSSSGSSSSFASVPIVFGWGRGV